MTPTAMPPTPSPLPARPIGGFFGLALPESGGGHSGGEGLAALWGFDSAAPAWANATSALAALVGALPGQVWLPAFLCPELALAVPPARRRFYPLAPDLALDLAPDLAPDIATLADGAVPGDIVLGVNFFGRAPGPAWRQFVANRRDLLFIEDCAQTVDTGEAPWGDWRLFSPRKLAGIPDGGLVVACSARAAGTVLPPTAPPVFADAAAALAPALARFECPDDNALWHPMNQAREAAHAISDRPMSLLSRHLLGLVDPGPLAARRRANFRVLADRLARFAMLPDRDPGFVPFGFPVRVPPVRRDAICQALYADRIFPAVHWRSLPVPRDPTHQWAHEWALADSIITLPCDQRWTTSEMEIMAEAFVQAAGILGRTSGENL